MKPLLQHLVEITGHRDHARLEISVISALHQLGGVKEIRALEVVSIGEETHIRPKAWIQDGKLHSIEESQHADLPRLPLAAYPALVKCIEQRLSTLETQGEAGETELWLPVWLHEKVVACLEIRNDKALSQDMLNVIHGIFHVYRNYQSLLDYSERDALTGLFNRKTFDAEFARPGHASGAAEADPTDVPQHWLAVVDIDHFKQLNDSFGHACGDEALKMFADTARGVLRDQDVIGRLGGEEFGLVLPGTTLDGALEAAERLRMAVAAAPVLACAPGYRMTVSIGVVMIDSSEELTAALARADHALYAAKTGGRNRVEAGAPVLLKRA